MKSALVVNPYWDSLGGGERYTATFIKLLLDNNWRVDVLWPTDVSSAIASRFGIDISSAQFLNRKYSSFLSASYPLMFWLSDGSLPLSFAAKTLLHFQFPFHNVGGRRFLNRIKSRFYIFVCNSQFTQSYIDPEFRIRSHVVYPPVDTSDFIASKKSKTILYVGRFSHLTQLKNPHLLISTFRQLSRHLLGWQLVLAGGAGVGTSPHTLTHLKRQAQGLPIKILTNPTLSRLKQLYAQASIFWSAAGIGTPSQNDPLRLEHFGITVVEAMAAGCVPIISNLGGHKEIVRPGQDGFLYRSLPELRQITLKLATNKQQLALLSHTAIQRAKVFDTAQFNQAFLHLI